MIRLQATPPTTVAEAIDMLQAAIAIEFGTLPPYLYAKFSILPDTNAPALARLNMIVNQEMIHLCLVCNIVNALGGSPQLTAPVYPGTLGNIGPPGGEPLVINLLPFSPDAMGQGMAIEEPEEVPDFPFAESLEGTGGAVTIGQYYAMVDAFLATLPDSAWTVGRNQITDDQFFAGQLFAVGCYADAHQAISNIVSEGEGAKDDPLDFQNELAHYYRFGEIYYDKVLTKTAQDPGYQWGPAPLGVDWNAVYPAIADPGSHDFSQDSAAAQAAQDACNAAFSGMVDALQQAVNGVDGQLGAAVRKMFELRMAAIAALQVPLADGVSVAGPSFLYVSTGAAS
ncbi:MAG: ferritin-like protein [Alphaproteobacteria bacterium]|nr:ferritin-like protein [Alphaproteobacteria bacterium]MBV9371508.1 ferritin-like protein [Alphaproteobacteria bacterium]MBV9902750.1 ferritin-like protein [Alphaproteobacteria bacterium]